MTTMIIENVPENEKILKIYGKKIDFSKYSISIIPKKEKKSSLADYIKNEYETDEEDVFLSADDFLKDLEKYKN